MKKNSLPQLVPRFTQTIEKYAEDKGLIVDRQEYDILSQMTDNDESHLERLDQVNDKCRYSDISTYEDNKVPLSSKEYINASWVHIPTKNFFISTQGPIPNTIEDFWQMIFDYDVKIIVMLCNLLENGSRKCENYWETPLNNFTIKVEKTEEYKDLSVVVRKFIVSKNNVQKEVKQLHYVGWPDKGVPEAEGVFDAFEKMISIVTNENEGSPVVIHCSAGVGRTGTFVALYNLYHEILNQIKDDTKKEIKFSVFSIVRKIKEMRMYMVQNQSQYNFIYDFIRTLLLAYNLKK